MDARDIDDIEAALDLRLPPAYRELMLAYPFGPQSQTAELWLPADADVVVANTERGRRSAALQPQPWPPSYVVIGGDGGEELYVLDVSREPAPVLAYELETRHTRPLAPDLAAFVGLLRAREAEVEADQRMIERGPTTRERQGGARWWQFWR